MTSPHTQLLPKESYYDPAWFERERRSLFGRSWFYACAETLVPKPGDFHTCAFLSHSLFVIRGADAESPLVGFQKQILEMVPLSGP